MLWNARLGDHGRGAIRSDPAGQLLHQASAPNSTKSQPVEFIPFGCFIFVYSISVDNTSPGYPPHYLPALIS